MSSFVGQTARTPRVASEDADLDVNLLVLLEEETVNLKVEKRRLERTLCDLEALIENQVGYEEKKLLEVREAAQSIQEQLEELQKPVVVQLPPPGPRYLRFVDGQVFMYVAAVVIISNIVTMLIELVEKKQQVPDCAMDDNNNFFRICTEKHAGKFQKKFFWLDQFYMIFYIVELILRALLWRRRLLFGRIAVVWWNWLDLAIVVSGVLDMYVRPLLMMTGILGRDHATILATVSKIMRFARLARLLRILKIVRVFFESDLSFVAGANFQLFIMGVIGFNCVQMGVEVDYPNFWGWPFVEHALLIIFTFELLVRLKYEGFSFFYSSENIVWNFLDFVIVAGGVIDMWLMPAIDSIQELMGHESKHSSNMGQVMTMLRMARLLRLLRLVRLMRSIPPLFHLMMGIIEAVEGMAWVLLLTAVLLYAFALLAVRLVGHGLVFGGEAPPDVAAVFPAIFPSMYTLFMVMNGNFGELQPLFDALPGTEIIFMAFMVLASWSVLAILTAVVSENMIKSTEEEKEHEIEDEHLQRVGDSTAALTSIFNEASQDPSGKLSEQQFLAILQNGNARARLIEAAGMQEDDVKRVFDDLSTKHVSERYIEIKHFVHALQDDEAPVTERDAYRIEQQLNVFNFIVTKGLEDILDQMKSRPQPVQKDGVKASE